jgi:uncharacterized protein
LKRIFIDTGAFLAKEIAADQHHAAATRCWSEAAGLRYRLFSSEHVLDETTTLLARRTSYPWASDWGKDALASGIEWLRADESEWRAALILMRKFGDQSVSFTDCLSFTLMKRAGIRTAFGFDRHFESAGYRLWPAGI